MDLKERLELLQEKRGRSQAEATRIGEFKNTTFINDIFRGHKKSVTGPNVAKLALAYSTTADFILGKTEDPELPGDGIPELYGRPEPYRETWEVRAATNLTRENSVRAIYGGLVEAGNYREIDSFDDYVERDAIYEPRDPEFPEATVVYFEVAGDSMNALTINGIAKPLLPGSRVIALDFESLKGRAPLRDGMVYVIERVRDGGHLRERSIKQLEWTADEYIFHPRSTNLRHKPIVVPAKAFDEGDETGVSVRVLALVRSVSNSLY